MLKAAVATLIGLGLLGVFVMQAVQDEPPGESGAVPVSSTGELSAGEAGATVRMSGSKYVPASLSVAVGTTVTWVNDDSFGHTVTPTNDDEWGTEGSGDGQDEWLPAGATWSFTFTKPGTYAYYCIPHAFKGDDGKYVGMVGTIVVGDAVSSAPVITERTVIPDPVAPKRMMPDADGIVRIELETQEVVAQIADGAEYTFWTFGGTVPGPMLRVREGDVVEITLRNAADSIHAHSIDLHAVTGPGGGAKATQTNAGDATAIRFTAMNPGLFVYHCATPHVPSHVANGMYGLILVEPKEGLPPVDREYYVVQGEVYVQGKVGDQGHLPFGYDDLLEERADYFLFNGRVGALTGEGALKANVNETVRIFFGVGGGIPSSFHVIGEIFDRVSMDANPPASTNRQTVMVPAAGAVMIDFKVDYPGAYVLVDHTLTRAIDRGAVGVLMVEGDADDAIFAPVEV